MTADTKTGRSLHGLVTELRLAEREDGGSTRDPGSARTEALAAEIDQRLAYLRDFAANDEEECRCTACVRNAIAYVLDGGDPP